MREAIAWIEDSGSPAPSGLLPDQFRTKREVNEVNKSPIDVRVPSAHFGAMEPNKSQIRDLGPLTAQAFTFGPSAEPAVLKDVAAEWPIVEAAKQGAGHCLALLRRHVRDLPVEILRADPSEHGRFHYRSDGQSLNFDRGRATLTVFLDALREQSASKRPYALAVQGLPAKRFVPGFADAHPMPLVPTGVEPRLWIGNASKVATHNDPVDNVAIVAAGMRRFTLFPPDAAENLYMRISEPTPAGTPVSMVHVTAPDVERYPRFADAMRVARVLELSPGDGLFIPRDWFHHVEALEPFNVLVNYWWDGSAEGNQPR